MIDQTTRDAAKIMAQAMREKYGRVDIVADYQAAALDKAGMLCAPGEVARLRTVAEETRAYVKEVGTVPSRRMAEALAALDAAPTGESGGE